MLLYKIAEKKKKNDGSIRGKAAAEGITAGLLAATAQGALANRIVKGDHLNGDKELSQDDIKKLYESVGGKKELNFEPSLFNENGNNKVSIHYDSPDSPHFMPLSKEIHIGKRTAPAVVAHEMGHSTSKVVNTTPGALAYSAGMYSAALTPLVGGYRLSKAYHTGKSKKERDKIKRQDDVAALALSSPVLYEESRANLKALQALKRIGKLNLKEATPVIVSEGSYLSLPALTLLSHKLVDWKHKLFNKKDKKTIDK